jgi:hypothetical protein
MLVFSVLFENVAPHMGIVNAICLSFDVNKSILKKSIL